MRDHIPCYPREISQYIGLILGATLSNKASYKLTPEHNINIAKQTHVLLQKGLITKSIIPCLVHVVLAPKKDGTWRVCTDSGAINMITKRYKFPIPRMKDLVDFLGGASYLSKIYLKNGCH